MGSDRHKRRRKEEEEDESMKEESYSSSEGDRRSSSKKKTKKDKKARRKKKRRYKSETEEEDSSEEEREERRKKKRAKRKEKDKKKKNREKVKRAQLKREEKLRKKELAKANETPEERKERRRQKKIAKKLKKEKEKSLFMGYSNDNNRFGDTDLTSPFIWDKKWEAKGISTKGNNVGRLVRKSIHKNQVKTQRELEKIRKDREDRQKDKDAQDAMRVIMQRELEAENYDLLEKKEEEFHIAQARLRARLRIKEGRWKPIDLLSKNISVLCGDEVDDDDEIDIDLQEPYSIISKLESDELEELSSEIDSQLELGENKEHWDNLKIVVQDEIRSLQQSSSNSSNPILDFVNTDGKSHSELLDLQDEMEKKIESANDDSNGVIDVEHWDTALKHLHVVIAKTFLKEQHQKLLQKRLTQLRTEQEAKHRNQDERADQEDGNDNDRMSDEEASGDNSDEESDEEDDGICYDPVYVTTKSPEYAQLLADCVDADHDLQILFEARDMVLQSKLAEFEQRERIRLEDVQSAQSFLSQPTDNQWGMSAEDMYRRESDKPIDDGEEIFSATVDVKNEVYWWHDKYRPRKPRFFNRVKTGYEWNKYNQTHYDHDNPPPKIVQGYKFNIFYPDLVDPTKPPTYVLQTDEKNSDYATLLFQAGPPYEDIAFKIVNKEWEESHKRGFKCRFERGILHLYFNFKQFRYRR